MITRRAFLGWMAALSAATAGYAGAVEPGFRLRVQEWNIAPKLWPRDLPLRIVAIADPHCAEPHLPLTRLERIVDRANELQGDLIVLLGDYVAGHRFISKPVPPIDIARVFGRLSAPIGVHAILGNHDWWEDPIAQARRRGPSIWHQVLAEAGVSLLENRSIQLNHRGQPFWLAGVGDPIAFLHQPGQPRGVDDFPAMRAQITDDAPAILLLHEPDFWPAWRDRFALSLCGHTHGGQIRLFGWSPIVPSSYGQRFAYGPVEEADRSLVVSGGLGCSILPVRFGMPPEITVINVT